MVYLNSVWFIINMFTSWDFSSLSRYSLIVSLLEILYSIHLFLYYDLVTYALDFLIGHWLFHILFLIYCIFCNVSMYFECISLPAILWNYCLSKTSISNYGLSKSLFYFVLLPNSISNLSKCIWLDTILWLELQSSIRAVIAFLNRKLLEVIYFYFFFS